MAGLPEGRHKLTFDYARVKELAVALLAIERLEN
jgi:hypothetical protein